MLSQISNGYHNRRLKLYYIGVNVGVTAKKIVQVAFLISCVNIIKV